MKILHGQNHNLTLNPDKTTCTHLTPDPAEYKIILDLKINNTALPMAMHTTVLGLTLHPKIIYITHHHNISVQAYKPLQIIKALTAPGWGKQKETLMTTYKAVMRPALEYVSSIWSPLASSTRINKLHVMQNSALKSATGCTYLHKVDAKHIHHHYAPSVTLTYTTPIISSTAPTYAPHCYPWICGQSPPEWLHCWSVERRSWLVDHKREDRTPPTNKGHGSG